MLNIKSIKLKKKSETILITKLSHKYITLLKSNLHVFLNKTSNSKFKFNYFKSIN